MKVAILSDVHSNLPALQTVLAHIEAWQPDHVIVNGDTVNRGPHPHTCWDILREKVDQSGWQMTLGNHEAYVLDFAQPQRDMTDLERELYWPAEWCYEQLSAENLAQMRTLPLSISLFAPDGSELRAAHASMRGVTDGVQPWTSTVDIRPKIAPAPAVFITSHTHRIFQRNIDDTLLVNTGAVGCPLDGLAKAGYAQLVWEAGGWSAELIRLDYDRVEARRAWHNCELLKVDSASAYIMYREWEESRSHIAIWRRTYRPRVMTGEMTPMQSVRAYFEELERLV